MHYDTGIVKNINLIKMIASLYANELFFAALLFRYSINIFFVLCGFSRVRLTLQALVLEKFKSESLPLDVQGQLIFKLVYSC